MCYKPIVQKPSSQERYGIFLDADRECASNKRLEEECTEEHAEGTRMNQLIIGHVSKPKELSSMKTSRFPAL